MGWRAGHWREGGYKRGNLRGVHCRGLVHFLQSVFSSRWSKGEWSEYSELVCMSKPPLGLSSQFSAPGKMAYRWNAVATQGTLQHLLAECKMCWWQDLLPGTGSGKTPFKQRGTLGKVQIWKGARRASILSLPISQEPCSEKNSRRKAKEHVRGSFN